MKAPEHLLSVGETYMISSNTSQSLRRVVVEIHATEPWRKGQVHFDWSNLEKFLRGQTQNQFGI